VGTTGSHACGDRVRRPFGCSGRRNKNPSPSGNGSSNVSYYDIYLNSGKLDWFERIVTEENSIILKTRVYRNNRQHVF